MISGKIIFKECLLMKNTRLAALFSVAAMILTFTAGCSLKSGDTSHGESETSRNVSHTQNSENSESSESSEETDIIVPTPYKRVILIGVDGAGAFFKDAQTPEMDRIFKDGATTYTMLSANPTISAQCWGSMLIGCSATAHGLTNDYIANNSYDVESSLPTVFRRIREAYPDAALASFCNWNPINIGIVENNLGVTFGTGEDMAVTDLITSYLSKNDPTFMFVQLDSVDSAGHANGYGSEGHLKQISVVDSYIGRIYDALEDNNLLDGTLIIVTTDHGGTPSGSHGGLSDGEKYVFFGAAGAIVEKGNIGEMEIRDIAAVVLFALGIDVPDFDLEGFSGQIPANLFTGYEVKDRKSLDIIPSPVDHETLPTPASGSGNYITDFLDKNKLEAVLFFDDNADDAMGNITTTVKGTPKYYSNGYYGSCIEVGKQGYITLNDLKVGADSFTISLWFYLDRSVKSDPPLYGNKSWKSGLNEGFVLSLRESDIKFNVGDGAIRSDFEYSLPQSISRGWVNTILVVDRVSNKVTFYYNFKKVSTKYLDDAFMGKSFDKLDFNIGEDGTGSYNAGNNIKIDDFIFYKGAMTDSEVAALAEYYGR